MIEIKKGLKFTVPNAPIDYYAIIGSINNREKKLLEIKGQEFAELLNRDGRYLGTRTVEEINNLFEIGTWIIYEE